MLDDFNAMMLSVTYVSPIYIYIPTGIILRTRLRASSPYEDFHVGTYIIIT